MTILTRPRQQETAALSEIRGDKNRYGAEAGKRRIFIFADDKWMNVLTILEQCKLAVGFYYHLRPSLKRDEFCATFYFSNVNGLFGRASLLANETLAVML